MFFKKKKKKTFKKKIISRAQFFRDETGGSRVNLVFQRDRSRSLMRKQR